MATQKKKAKALDLKPVKPVVKKEVKLEKKTVKKASKVVESAPKKRQKKEELTGTEYDLELIDEPLEGIKLDKKSLRSIYWSLTVSSIKNYFKTFTSK